MITDQQTVIQLTKSTDLIYWRTAPFEFNIGWLWVFEIGHLPSPHPTICAIGASEIDAAANLAFHRAYVGTCPVLFMMKLLRCRPYYRFWRMHWSAALHAFISNFSK